MEGTGRNGGGGEARRVGVGDELLPEPVDDDEASAAKSSADVAAADAVGAATGHHAHPAGACARDDAYDASASTLASAVPNNKVRAQMRRDDLGGRSGVGRVSTGAVELVAVCSALLLRDLAVRASDLAFASAAASKADSVAHEDGGGGGRDPTTEVVRAEHVRDAVILPAGAVTERGIDGGGDDGRDGAAPVSSSSPPHGFLADAVRGVTDSSFPVRNGTAGRKRKGMAKATGVKRRRKRAASAATVGREEGALVADAAAQASMSSSGATASWNDAIVEDEDDYD